MELQVYKIFSSNLTHLVSKLLFTSGYLSLREKVLCSAVSSEWKDLCEYPTGKVLDLRGKNPQSVVSLCNCSDLPQITHQQIIRLIERGIIWTSFSHPFTDEITYLNQVYELNQIYNEVKMSYVMMFPFEVGAICCILC